MNCPICKNKLITTNSRGTASGMQTWRRKHCKSCGLLISSKEVLDLSEIIIIEGVGYSRNKLGASIAGWTPKKSEEYIFDIVNTIEQNILTGAREITKKDFLDIVGNTLRKVSYPAYLRMMAKVEEEL